VGDISTALSFASVGSAAGFVPPALVTNMALAAGFTPAALVTNIALAAGFTPAATMVLTSAKRRYE